MRLLLPLLAAVTLVVTAAPPGGSRASAQQPQPEQQPQAQPTELQDRFPVAPGLVREVYGVRTQAGPSVAHVLRFDRDDPTLTLTPELGDGQVPGREPVHRMLQRIGPPAVAAVNGGFWSGAPSGDPDGLLVRDRRHLSEAQNQRFAPRAAFALLADGSYRVGRPSYSGSVGFASGTEAPLGGINRQPGGEEIVALTGAYDEVTGTPPAAIEVVLEDFEPSLATEVAVPVGAVRAGGDNPIPEGGTVLVATGRWATEAAGLTPGDLLTVDVGISGGWLDSVQALAGGPLIVRDGRLVPPDEWFGEGFDDLHNKRPHPRTLVGFTADGEVLLVTVDGRQPGRSVGLTTQQAAELMLALGARDALMMDGGGSTTMAVDGRLENRPCCDSPGYRAVANGLVVRSSVQTPDVVRVAGPDRYATAAAVAGAGWSGGADTVLVASGRDFPDGLAGGPLGQRLGAPLLLTEPGGLPQVTAEAITSLGARRAVVLGGPAAVGDEVAVQLRGLGLDVRRIFGQGRVETAAAIAREVGARQGRAFVASGAAFPDALSATVPAVLAEGPVLLTGPEALAPATAAALGELGVEEVLVAGGPAAVSETVVEQLEAAGYAVTRLAGANRYGTSVALAQWVEQALGYDPPGLMMASGGTFPDALSGGPYAAILGLPILLTPTHAISRAPEVDLWLNGHDPRTAVVLGGRVVVSSWVSYELQQALRR